MKALIIGDTHFEDNLDGYLSAQIDCLEKVIEESNPDLLIFLGDIFHLRKPTPRTISRVSAFFHLQGGREIIVLRGNHDSTSKSDDDETILNILEFMCPKLQVIRSISYLKEYNILGIPHYENEAIVEHFLTHPETFYSSVPQNALLLGHVGFKGCMNVQNDYTFKLDPNLFKHRTILGHIHRYAEHQNIVILGTPWPTNFGENDYNHYVAETTLNPISNRWSDLKLIEVTKGPRFYTCPYEALESMEEDIVDPTRFTALRVILNKFEEDDTSDLKNKILSRYKVNNVDFKFQPIYDKKLNNRLSDYDPQSALDSISDNIIDKYLDEQKSTIPTEDLKRGLEKIKLYADKEDQD